MRSLRTFRNQRRPRLSLAAFTGSVGVVRGAEDLLDAGAVLIPFSNASFESPAVSTGNNWSSPAPYRASRSPTAGIRHTASDLIHRPTITTITHAPRGETWFAPTPTRRNGSTL